MDALNSEKLPRNIRTLPKIRAALKRSSQEFRFGNLTKNPSQTPLKVLLVVGRDDATTDTLRGAAERLGYDVRVVKSKDTAVDALHATPADLVFVDCRYSRNLDGEATCRSLRNIRSSLYTVIVALVRRSLVSSTNSEVDEDQNHLTAADPPALIAYRITLDTASELREDLDNALTSLKSAARRIREEREEAAVMIPGETSPQKTAAPDVLPATLDSTAEKEEAAVIPYLNAGFNRWMFESTNPGLLMSELLQLEHSDVLPRQQLATAQALFLVIDKSRDVVHITDSNHTIQYVNRAGEKLLGYSQRELVGRNVMELNQMEGKELMFQQLSRGREWEGTVAWPRRVSGPTEAGNTPSMPAPLNCRVLPVSAPGRPPSHFVFIHEVPGPGMAKRTSDSASVYPPSRGSMHSVRRNSDIRSISSDGTRRQSIAKLHNLSIEAPITKVISLISAAQENSSSEVVAMLDKVVDILRTTELYAPVMKDDKLRPGDPVTSDLISALLSGNVTPHSGTRRSSNDSAVSRNATAGGVRPVVRPGKMSSRLREVLEMSLLWEFNIFKLEKLSSNRPLLHLGMNLMTHFEVPQALGCDEATLHNWLTIIEINYHPTNSYHNSTHAADVLQAAACFLERERLRQLMEPLDEATCLIAAAAHDVDHPGKSSAFLCNAGNPLAILYNDMCVLESHHAALTFKLTMSDDRVNIFKGLERDTYKRARQSVIDMILATDMTKHFEHLAKFVNVCSKPGPRDDEPVVEVGSETADANFLATPENIALVKRMLIKCSDVSNPARPLRMCVEWANRIAEEYFTQTDEEKAANLPVMMPMFDRATCSIPKSQIGFMDFIINDMFEAWEAFIEMPELMNYIDSNYRFWQEKEQQGITTIADLKMEPYSIDLVEEDSEPSVSTS